MAEIRTETMTVNMGPQHPSTHGVLRLVLDRTLAAGRFEELGRGVEDPPNRVLKMPPLCPGGGGAPSTSSPGPAFIATASNFSSLRSPTAPTHASWISQLAGVNAALAIGRLCLCDARERCDDDDRAS